MPQYSVFTNEYDVDIVQLLRGRLSKQKTDEAAKLTDSLRSCREKRCCAEVDIESDAEMSACCTALGELISIDLRYFEMAEMIDRLKIDEEKKRTILKNAVEYSKYCISSASLIDALMEYFAENRSLNLEGYIRFRLRDRLEIWRAAVDSAIDDELDRSGYFELLSFLDALSVLDGGRDSVTVVLNPDASCTIMNEYYDGSVSSSKRIRIDCAPGNCEGALGMLSALSPDRIALVDLSFGACEALKRRLLELFTVQ